MEVRRAFLSVHDKSNLEHFVRSLQALEIEVVATSGTAEFLKEKGILVTPAATYTGSPELFDGTLKTLHPRIHGGMAATDDEGDQAELTAIGGGPIDILAVNLTPVVAQTDVGLDNLLRQVDLGGPSLIRTGVCNYQRVTVLVDPEDYGRVLKQLLDYQRIPEELRRKLAIKAMATLARYDALLGREVTSYDQRGERRPTPELMSLLYERFSDLPSGDNEHQSATMYGGAITPPGTLPQAILYGTGKGEVPTVQQLRDAAMALDLLAEFPEPAVTVVSRRRPVATVVGGTIESAVAAAIKLLGPRLSSGLLATNAQIDPACPPLLRFAPIDALVAPSFHADALPVLQKRDGLCILATRGVLPKDRAGWDLVPIPAGLVVEQRDAVADGEVAQGKVMSQRQPLPAELRALDFAWKVAKYTRSDAIVIARVDSDGTLRTVGVGGGGTTRREAIELALSQAGPAAAGGVVASDGTIDDASDLDVLMKRGIVALAHPGGPKDADIIAAGSNVLALIATGVSHLRD
jgi:phosphoribosylaminoimidazolecarboxamide formyltransferase/IMP cyclohydrolase